MKLFVGLGNPGAKYASTRHNIGFMAVDQVQADHGFAPWKSKFQGKISEGKLGSEKVLLLKPETFMNLSGQSVGEAMRFYKLTPEDVCVFHDELDLQPGRLKVKTGGGHAGHNGLRSMHAHIGETYQRVRIGIGHPGRKELVSGYVLHDFARADAEWLDDLMRGISDGAADLAAGDAGRFMNAVALRVAPPRPATGNRPERGNKTEQAAKKPAKPSDQSKADSPAASKPVEPPNEGKVEAVDAPDNRSALQKLADRFR